MKTEIYDSPDPISALIRQIRKSIHEKDLVTAEALCLRVLDQEPEHPDGLFLLGIIAQHTGDLELAVGLFEGATLARPTDVTFLYTMGLTWKALGSSEQAETCFCKAVEINPSYAPAYRQLGNICYDSSRIDEANQAYQKAFDLGLTSAELLFELAISLREQNRTQEAIDLFKRICQADPDHLSAFLHAHLSLPVFYETEASIQYWRDRYTQGLAQVCDRFRDPSIAPQIKRKAISRFAPFYLNYQCQNDRDLQIQYGHLVNSITTQLFPQRSKSALPSSDRIRIGFISASLFNHSVARSSLSWVTGLNRDQFEIYCYHIGRQIDGMTNQYQQASDRFHHFPEDILSVANQVIEDDLHLALFLDIGMSPLMTQLGSLRLAPIQAVRWGHPITTGLPTIDYYISSDVMEPLNAQDHYSEKLTLLPGIGKALLDHSDLQLQQVDRSLFDLPKDATLYLSPQSLIKYLPQYDDIYPQIVDRFPQGHFVFMARANTQRVVDQFKERLQKAFARFSLDWTRHCSILSKLGYRDYVQLNRSCDIFLDSIGWSGDNTVLDAVAAGLPVVTLPGEYMRGCHAAGILRFLEVTETIANDIPDYIDKAVHLGQDNNYRQRASAQIKQNHHRLLYDDRHIRFLEVFYAQAVNHHRSQDQTTEEEGC